MTRSTPLSLVAAFLALGSTQSFAQTELPGDVSMTANAGLFTDYRFRGISQTNKNPAFQGGFDFSHKSGFYLGNWNSNVDAVLYNGGNLEMDFYGGFKGSFDAFSYDVGVLYYYYPGSGAGGTNKIDNTELYVAGGWGPISLKYSYDASNFFGVPDSKGAYYFDATVNYPLTKEFSLIGHVGYQGNLKNGAQITEIDGSGPFSSLTDWKLGATYDLKGWLLGASYIDTNRSLTLGTAALSNKSISGSTLVLSVVKTF
ncbi:MAG TPA: TorF family putative porin [Burkholderiaceae bacterium]